MKRPLLTLAMMAVVLLSLAQSPSIFNYQAVVRSADGKILQNSSVTFKFSVLRGSSGGPAVYVETHSGTTNQYGLINLSIGSGSLVSGEFATIQWGQDLYFLKVAMDVSGGSNFVDMSTQQLVAVPYALHAGTVSLSDNDTTNEYQTLTQSGTDVSLSDGGGTISVADNDNDATNELQSLSISGTDVTLSGGGGTVSVADNDNSSSNEIQTLSKNGINLSLSGGGGTVDIADNDNDASNELQTLSRTGINVTLSNGGGTINVADNDNSSTNELQTLTLNSDSLSLSNSSPSIALDGLNHWQRSSSSLYTDQYNVGIGAMPASSNIAFGIQTDSNQLYGMQLDQNGLVGTGYSMGGAFIQSERPSSSVGTTYGIRNRLYHHPNSGAHGIYGIHNVASSFPSSSSNAQLYGFYQNVIRGSEGNGSAFGFAQDFYHSGSGFGGDMYGSYQTIRRNASTSNTIASSNYGTTYGTYKKMIINPSTSGYQTYGDFNLLYFGPDDASGASLYAQSDHIYRSDSGSGSSVGYFLNLDHGGNDGATFGMFHDIDATGQNPATVDGYVLQLYSNGTGEMNGIRSSIVRAGGKSGLLHGIETEITASPNSGSSSVHHIEGHHIKITANPGSHPHVAGLFVDLDRGGSGQGASYGQHVEMSHTGLGDAFGSHIFMNRTTSNYSYPTYGYYADVNLNAGTAYGLRLQVDHGNSTSSSGIGNSYGTSVVLYKRGTGSGNTYGGSFLNYNYNTYTGTSYAYGVTATATHSSTAGNSYTYGGYFRQYGSADAEYAGYFVGDVFCSGSYLPSDAMLKTDVKEAGSSLDRLMGLTIYTYQYDQEKYGHMNLPEGEQTGFVASDLATRFPELTTLAHMAPVEDEVLESLSEEGIVFSDQARKGLDFSAVNYTGLVPHLTKAIQEQQYTIEALELQIELLEQRLEQLESK